jgi:predicted ATPase
MITRCEIATEVAEPLGLRPAVLERLGRTVVLAGPNGGGKSRYLRAVRQAIRETKKPFGLRALRADAIEQWNVASLRVSASTGKVSLVELTYPFGRPAAIDIASMNADTLETESEGARTGDFGAAYSKMHSYLAAHAKALWDAKHPDLEENAEIRARRERALGFDAIFRQLLGRSLTHRYDGKVPLPLVGGRVFSPGEFSEGEKLLIAWAITFFERGTALDGAVVFLDEPDVHLHADACLQALSRLRGALGETGQIWMATHSVPVIANFGFDSLYLVQEGGIEYASRNADRVVRSLLGGDEARHRLLEFLVDADRIAQVRFLLECLLPAGVAEAAGWDRQQLQFTALVAARVKKGDSVRVLDYGAGRGRFASALKEWLDQPEHEGQRGRIDYHAFQDEGCLDASDHAACRQRVEALGLDPAAHVWTKATDLLAEHRERFDLVVLCNVLHEIDPKDWPRVLSQIEQLLCADGTLVVMEDLFPSVGELPSQTGFVILNGSALKALFAPRDAVHVVTGNDRVMVAEVGKARLKATNDTRDAALKMVCEQAKEGIRAIRLKETPDHHDGRKQAVWAMQFANASLALGS